MSRRIADYQWPDATAVDISVAALIRVSGDAQDEQRQISEIEAYCKAKGIHIDKWFRDKLSRDNADNRPEFQELLRLVKARRVKVVIVQKLDRFGITDSDEWGHYRWEFRQAGCKIISVHDGDLTAADAATKITSTLKADGSAEEQRNIGSRTMGGRAEKAKLGEWGGGPAPFGYDKICLDAQGNLVWRLVKVTPDHHIQILPDGTRKHLHGRGNTPRRTNKYDKIKLAINEQDAEIVREIYRLWISRLISLRGIAVKLNREGRRIHGKPFKQATIKRILRNRRYLGHSIWNEIQMGRFNEYRDGKTVLIPEEVRREKMRGRKKKYIYRRNSEDQLIIKENAWDAIITVDDFNEAQKKLRKLKDKKGRVPRNDVFWLKDLVVCAGCGKPMMGEIHKGVAWYCCRTFINADKSGLGDQCSCSRNTIKAADVEEKLYVWLANHKLVLKKVSEMSDAETIFDAIKGEIANVRDTVNELAVKNYYDRIWEDFNLDEPGSKYAELMVQSIGYLREAIIDAQIFDGLDQVRIKEAVRQEEKLKEELADIVRRKAASRSELEEEVWIKEQDKVEARIRRMRVWQVPHKKRWDEAKHKLDILRERLDAFNPAVISAQEKGEAIRRIVRTITLEIVAEPNLTGLVHQAMKEIGPGASSRAIQMWLEVKGVAIATKNIATLRKQRGTSNRKRYILKDFHVDGVFSERRQNSAIDGAC